MRIFSNVKYCYVINLKFGVKFLTSLTKLVLGAKATTCSTIKENLLLYCRQFSAFVVVDIIKDILFDIIEHTFFFYCSNLVLNR